MLNAAPVAGAVALEQHVNLAAAKLVSAVAATAAGVVAAEAVVVVVLVVVVAALVVVVAVVVVVVVVVVVALRLHLLTRHHYHLEALMLEAFLRNSDPSCFVQQALGQDALGPPRLMGAFR